MSRKKSVSEKEKEGTLKPTRAIVDKTAPLKNWVKAPIKLSENGKLIYSAVLMLLITNEVATKLDTYAIALFADWLDIYETYSELCRDKGFVQTFESGATNITGYFSVKKEANKSVESYMKKLGLSIKDREMITAYMENRGEEEEDPFSAMARMIVETD
jgi:P27 family predicted phage terminase small subunit